MNKAEKKKWYAEVEQEMLAKARMIEVVLCDFCGEDWSESSVTGGILFQSKAVCPKCAPSILASAKKYGEEEIIRATCPDGMSFASWVCDCLRPKTPERWARDIAKKHLSEMEKKAKHGN